MYNVPLNSIKDKFLHIGDKGMLLQFSSEQSNTKSKRVIFLCTTHIHITITAESL